MKIRELSIKNCLSFCEKGLNNDNSIQLGDFNLFIGSNNAGKSNLLKLVKLIQGILFSLREQGGHSLLDVPLSLEGVSINFKDWFFAQDLDSKMSFSFSLEIEQADQNVLRIPPYDHKSKNPNPVLFMFKHKNDWPKVLKLTGFIEYKERHPFVTITKVEIPNNHKYYSKEPVLFDREARKLLALKPGDFRDALVWKIISYSDEEEWDRDYVPIHVAIHDFFAQLYDRVFKTLIVDIPAIREIKPLGDEIVESLCSLRDGIPEQIRFHNSVVDYIKTLVFITESQQILFVYPQENGKRRINIQIGELQLPLSHYGSGVEQMLALAAEIARHGTNKVISIEEPEAHFHPGLQRKFIRFLRENEQTFAHQYLIATHSNIFIDEFTYMNGSVFYVHLNQDNKVKQKYSQVELLNRENLGTLFKELGVKPADLFLANGILVVEGSIDKDVYTDWARKIGKPFEKASILIIDAEGAGNIPKYLSSEVLQRTSFKNYALCDKNSETIVRNAVKGIVPDEEITVLDKGDIEDYYPRELVSQFAREWGLKKGRKKAEIPDEIKVGETVKKLCALLKGDWWKRLLASKVIAEMKPDDIHDEIKDKLTEIYNSIY